MEVGIFGGSFDPIHTGHAMVANYLSQFSILDEVWLMPSPQNPLKHVSKFTTFGHRLVMCRLVSEKCHAVSVSDFESRLSSPFYTYRTLCGLRSEYPECHFKLIIGSDNWLSFERWKDPEKIIEEFGLIIYPRPGYPVSRELPRNVIYEADAPVVSVSSTFIRKALAESYNMNYFLDKDVLEYIKVHRLYK